MMAMGAILIVTLTILVLIGCFTAVIYCFYSTMITIRDMHRTLNDRKRKFIFADSYVY